MAIKIIVKKISDNIHLFFSKSKKEYIALWGLLKQLFSNFIKGCKIHKWRTAWVIYTVLFVFAVIFWCIFNNQLLIQACTLFFTIFAMVIIMLQNNEKIEQSTKQQIDIIQLNTSSHIQALKESTDAHIQCLRDTSQSQIQTFIEQCQGIVAQLEQTVCVLVKISSQNEQQLKVQEDLRCKNEELSRKMLEEQIQRQSDRVGIINRMRPNIWVRLYIDSHYLFWKHYQLSIYNSGNEYHSVKIHCLFSAVNSMMKQPIKNKIDKIKREEYNKIDLGNIDNFKGYDKLTVWVAGFDVQGRNYCTSIDIVKDNSDWHNIILSESDATLD